MIEPTVGRVVWFYPARDDRIMVPGGFPIQVAELPLAATIAYVNADGTINIGFLDARGAHYSKQGVRLLQDGDARSLNESFCEWMPFQKGQAKAQDAAKPATPKPSSISWSNRMRKLTDHIVNPANDKLTITVLDAPGAGGAHHLYMVEGFDTASNASDPFIARHGAPAQHATILFQNGPIPEKGVNGLTHEVLLAILIDRLRSFQAGSYGCKENAEALHHLGEARRWLHSRTLARMKRGVEGTHTI